jgi:oligopeptidase A
VLPAGHAVRPQQRPARTLYRAYVTRASDQAPREFRKFDNTHSCAKSWPCARKKRRLLGYRNFGEVSVVAKMADSPQQVITFLRDLAAGPGPTAEKDLADMRAFAASSWPADPQPWDWPYIGEKLKEARYAFSEQEVKQYFTAPKVLAGLFKIVETLFEVAIRRDSAPVWHPSVEFYRIERGGHQLVGQFYLDPSARTGKRGGAWMDDVRARWLRPDNGSCRRRWRIWCATLPTGVDGKPALLTHDDVTTCSTSSATACTTC